MRLWAWSVSKGWALWQYSIRTCVFSRVSEYYESKPN